MKTMNTRWARLAVATAAGALATAAIAADMTVKLAGDQEVPPVMTSASGTATVHVGDDGAVSGGITVSGVEGTMAHIHDAAKGMNGPVIVPLVKDGSNFKFAPGAKLTASQMADLKAGKLYINVHSAAHPGGEIRAQLN